MTVNKAPYTRDHFPELFKERGYKIGAEIGVRMGEYSQILLENTPGIKLFCIDSWAPYSEVKSNRKQDRYKRIALKRLVGLNPEIIQKLSLDALADFKNESLDFIYIDAANDYANVKADLEGWALKVKPGGFISGHDYFNHRNFGVVRAVDEYAARFDITVNITSEEVPSFFWVKSGKEALWKPRR